MRCIVCGEDHQPSASVCDPDGMDREAAKLGAKRWNYLTAHVSRTLNQRNNPIVPWELDCQRHICAAPECECPALSSQEQGK